MKENSSKTFGALVVELAEKIYVAGKNMQNVIEEEEKPKWYPFHKSKGSRQKRPPVKKYVLVLCKSKVPQFPDPILLGYMKNVGGDKQSPHFITPGGNAGEACAWCDCLPETFEYPLVSWK